MSVGTHKSLLFFIRKTKHKFVFCFHTKTAIAFKENFNGASIQPFFSTGDVRFEPKPKHLITYIVSNEQ